MTIRRKTGPLMSRAVTVIFLLLLAGCAVDSVRRFGDQRLITDQNRGYVLLSFGPARAPGYATHYNVLLRERPGGRDVSILYTKDAIFVTPTRPDFSGNAGEGALYLVELAAGDYEIYRYRIFATNRYQMYSPDVSMPFTVKPGQITYVGRFMIEPIWTGGNAYYAPVFLGAIHTNDFQQDVEIARRKFPAETGSARIETEFTPGKERRN